MDFSVVELVNDLKKLRRGYGIETADVPARLGPALRAVCGIGPQDSPAVMRHKVRHRLTELVRELPADMADFVSVALGLGGSATVRYEERVARLASEMDRDPRTARRRVDEALRRLAESALAAPLERAPSSSNVPWHTVRLQVVMVVHEPAAEVFETRRIVAHQPGLSELDHSVTVVRPPGWGGGSAADLGIRVIQGASLGTPQPQGPRRIGFRLRLPRSLDAGEQHEFSFQVALFPPFEPYYVCTPRYPCDRFDVTVRFQPDRVPERIWLLDNELPIEISEPWPHRRRLQADQVGDVRHRFTGLEPNRSYGIGWQPLIG